MRILVHTKRVHNIAWNSIFAK